MHGIFEPEHKLKVSKSQSPKYLARLLYRAFYCANDLGADVNQLPIYILFLLMSESIQLNGNLLFMLYKGGLKALQSNNKVIFVINNLFILSNFRN